MFRGSRKILFFVWIKNRTSNGRHHIYYAARLFIGFLVWISLYWRKLALRSRDIWRQIHFWASFYGFYQYCDSRIQYKSAYAKFKKDWRRDRRSKENLWSYWSRSWNKKCLKSCSDLWFSRRNCFRKCYICLSKIKAEENIEKLLHEN